MDAWLGGSDAAAIDKALDETYAATKLGTVDARLALLTTDRAGFEASTDPLLKLAVALQPTLMELEDNAPRPRR